MPEQFCAEVQSEKKQKLRPGPVEGVNGGIGWEKWEVEGRPDAELESEGGGYSCSAGLAEERRRKALRRKRKASRQVCDT